VFGDDVVLFSVKDCAFLPETSVLHGNGVPRAIDDSVRQLKLRARSVPGAGVARWEDSGSSLAGTHAHSRTENCRCGGQAPCAGRSARSWPPLLRELSPQPRRARLQRFLAAAGFDAKCDGDVSGAQIAKAAWIARSFSLPLIARARESRSARNRSRRQPT